MLGEVGKALEFLQEMKERHEQVSRKTGALHQACEQLVEEQVRTRGKQQGEGWGLDLSHNIRNPSCSAKPLQMGVAVWSLSHSIRNQGGEGCSVEPLP